MDVAALVVSICGVIATTVLGWFTYKNAVGQRSLQERVTEIEKKRFRIERKEYWRQLYALPLVNKPASDGAGGQRVRVLNIGAATADIGLKVEFHPPGWRGWESVLHPKPIESGDFADFDITTSLHRFVNDEYLASLPDLDRPKATQYLRFFAYTIEGPKAEACTYGTAEASFRQADWDVVKEEGSIDRVEAILPPPPSRGN